MAKSPLCAPHNILINTVCPRFTRTDRIIELAHAQAASSGTDPGVIFQRWTNAIPLGRLGEPGELVATTAFLASERASYITGTTIQIDGGFSKGLL